MLGASVARAASTYGSQSSFGNTTHTVMLGVTPNVGYVQPLSEHLYFWPRLGVTLSRAFQTEGPPIIAPQSTVTPHLQALLAWSPAEHFFIAAGPAARATWAHNGDSDSSGTALGVMTMLGGYFSP
jgi:hypothetical protein